MKAPAVRVRGARGVQVDPGGAGAVAEDDLRRAYRAHLAVGVDLHSDDFGPGGDGGQGDGERETLADQALRGARAAPSIEDVEGSSAGSDSTGVTDFEDDVRRAEVAGRCAEHDQRCQAPHPVQCR